MLFTALFFLIAFAAVSVGGVVGFGSATMLIPFASLVLDLKQAIILVAFFHGFGSLFKLLRLRRNVDRRVLVSFGIPSLVAAFFGARLLESVATGVVTLAFAAFISIFAAFSLLRPAWRLPSRRGLLPVGGVLAGFSAGMIGVGGAVRGLFLISTRLPKEAYVATAAAIAAVTDVTRISVYVVSGALEPRYYWYILPLILIAYLGTSLGVRLLRRFPETIVRRAVLLALMLVSVKLVLDYFGVIPSYIPA